MKRLTKARYIELCNLVVERDQLFCFVGGEPPTSQPLFLDRWDCNPENNDPENFKILCHPMRVVKCPWIRPRQQSPQLLNNSICEKMFGQADEPDPTTSLEFLKSLVAVPLFSHFLFKEVVTLRQISLAEALNSGSAVARISQVTARRYLDKETSKARLFQVDPPGGDRFVRLKPEWEGFRKVLADRKKLNMEARNWSEGMLDGLPVTMSRPKRKKDQSTDTNESKEQSEKS